jgi:cytochrome c oxidase subunit 4
MSETAVSKSTYLVVWASLLILLAITVGVSYIHLGWFNAAAAVAIAVIKAVIIILYFMHVRYSPKILWIFVGAGFFWLGIMFVLTLGDYFTRAYLPVPTIWLAK